MTVIGRVLKKMSMELLKSSQSNIVINELLCFVQNILDVMDEESAVKLCASSFSSKEIGTAKHLLFKSLSTIARNVAKRNNKDHKKLRDIIYVFKNTDSDITPIFVAKELLKLPPITSDCVDVTKLLKNIVVLKSEVNNLKKIDLPTLRTDVDAISKDYVSIKQLEELHSDIDNMKKVSSVHKFNRNIKYQYGLQPAAPSAVSEVSPCGSSVVTHPSTAVAVEHIADPLVTQQRDINSKSLSDIKRETECGLIDQNGKWIVVQRKKKSKNRYVHHKFFDSRNKF